MSKQMKILSGIMGVLVVAAVVLTMFGKPPNLPLGPLQGMLAGEEEPVVDAAVDPLAGGVLAADCVPGAADPTTGLPADGAGGTPGAVDPVTGLPTDSGADAGGTDPATGAADPASGGAGAVDPATGAPIAAPGDGWAGDSRVSAAGVGYDASRISDQRIVAAEAVDPATGLPVPDPTGTATDAGAGAVDPVTGLPSTDPAATDPIATDPATGDTGVPAEDCVDETASGAVDPTTGAVDAAEGGAGADAAGATGAGATGAGATGAGATGTTAAASTTDGTNSGNSPEALRAAKDATGVMQKAKINVTTTATLVPSAGGVAKAGPLRRYRATVTGAVLVIKLDDAAMQQWTGAGKKVQRDLVTSFITRLGKTYAKASRSVTVVDTTGNVLAIGDAAPRARVAVKLF